MSVLVHNGAHQQIFAVHKELIKRRSEFFRLVIDGGVPGSGGEPEPEPIQLEHRDPEIFDRYLHCVYHNEVPKVTSWPQTAREGSKTQSAAFSFQDSVDMKFRDLFKIYDLAFFLDDLITANLVISEMQSFCGPCSRPPGPKVIELVFRKTHSDDRLHNLLVDFYIYGATRLPDGDIPHAFLALFMRRFLAAKKNGWIEVGKSHRMTLETPGGDAAWNKSQYYKDVFEYKEPQRYEEDSE